MNKKIKQDNANKASLKESAEHAQKIKAQEAIKVQNNTQNNKTSDNSMNSDQQTNNNTPQTQAQNNTTNGQQPSTQPDSQLTEREKINQAAQDANTRLQPWYTGTAAASNVGQLAYYVTGSVSNVVGQGTAIVNSITGVISAIRSLI